MAGKKDFTLQHINVLLFVYVHVHIKHIENEVRSIYKVNKNIYKNDVRIRSRNGSVH